MSSTSVHAACLETLLDHVDPEISAAIDDELARQRSTLEMIASENFAPVAVLQAQGSVLTNKYAEGYPGRRYYGGCEHVDVVERQRRVVDGARIVAERLSSADCAADGIRVLTGGTDVHLVLVDLVQSELDRKQAEQRLHDVGITVNRNAVPNDPRPPMITSGLRIGTPALAARGFGASAFAEVADVIAAALLPEPDLAGLRSRCEALAAKHPLYAAL
nr:hypothetical protein [Haloechinothrix halophila]